MKCNPGVLRFALRLGIILSCAEVARGQAEAPPRTVPLTLAEARSQALRIHPRITTADLRALAARQRLVQERAAWWPQVFGASTAVGTDDPAGLHVSAGSLNAPGVYERAGVGGTVSQLITDFGRTANQVASARLDFEAAATNALATRQQLIVEVDAAYFGLLRARAVSAVAAATLSSRQHLLDQATALASNHLRSELDVRFAQVGVDEARLMVSRSRADVEAAGTSLALYLAPSGADQPEWLLVDEPLPEIPAKDAGSLVARALAGRPDLVALRLGRDASRRRVAAIRGQQNPTLSVFGAAGVSPVHDDHFGHEYAAAGVNLSIPIFAGGLYQARQREALHLADAATSAVAEAELKVIRDVRLAWLEVVQAREALGLSRSLAASAEMALQLAQARFDQGLSSIVELNQADLNRTRAEIGVATAAFDLRLRADALEYAAGTLH
jgi:outer membrane protein